MTTDDLWLDEVQERSFNRANPATTSSLPTGNRMTGAQLVHLLRPGAYGVLATTRPGGRPHAAPTSLVLQDQAIWLPTVAGAVCLTNLAAHPWASLVVMRGEGTEHLMVTLEGPATIVDAEAEDVAPPPAGTATRCHGSRRGSDWRRRGSSAMPPRSTHALTSAIDGDP